MDETLEDARARDRLGREIEVLILVKTTPNPSATYEDTVCVAGLALAPGPPQVGAPLPGPLPPPPQEHPVHQVRDHPDQGRGAAHRPPR